MSDKNNIDSHKDGNETLGKQIKRDIFSGEEIIQKQTQGVQKKIGTIQDSPEKYLDDSMEELDSLLTQHIEKNLNLNDTLQDAKDEIIRLKLLLSNTLEELHSTQEDYESVQKELAHESNHEAGIKKIFQSKESRIQVIQDRNEQLEKKIQELDGEKKEYIKLINDSIPLAIYDHLDAEFQDLKELNKLLVTDSLKTEEKYQQTITKKVRYIEELIAKHAEEVAKLKDLAIGSNQSYENEIAALKKDKKQQLAFYKQLSDEHNKLIHAHGKKIKEHPIYQQVLNTIANLNTQLSVLQKQASSPVVSSTEHETQQELERALQEIQKLKKINREFKTKNEQLDVQTKRIQADRANIQHTLHVLEDQQTSQIEFEKQIGNFIEKHLLNELNVKHKLLGLLISGTLPCEQQEVSIIQGYIEGKFHGEHTSSSLIVERVIASVFHINTGTKKSETYLKIAAASNE